MRSLVRCGLVGAVVALCAQSAAAQERLEFSDAAEHEFRAAVAMYDSGAYRIAAAAFDRLMREYPSSHRTTAALVMKGKALCEAQENLEAAKTLKSFLARFPSSSYAADAEYTLGRVYGRIDRWEEAMDLFLAAFRRLGPSSPDRLARNIMAAMDSAVNVHLPITALHSLLARAVVPSERAWYWLTTAERETAGDNSVAALIALDSLDGRYPDHPFHARSADLRSRLQARSSIALGVLLPLMRNADPSAVKDIANEVYDGIVFAVEHYGRDPAARITVALETRDTEREPQRAVQGAQELADNRQVIGILGPVFSATVTPAAVVANAHGVPLITPTANADGIAATGAYVFQANPDYDARGRAMARYAIQKRGFHSLAVIAPVDAYGKFLAEGFVREAERLGAHVLATEWYQRGTSDLKLPLSRIRRAGMLVGDDVRISFSGRMTRATMMQLMDCGVPLRRLDSLMSKGAVISARELLGNGARRMMDSLDIHVAFDESRVDSMEYPVESIEAIYAPISTPEEIGVVSSQVVYFNFRTQILGGGEWYNFAELSANRRYCEGVEFDSDTYVDTARADFKQFVDDFSNRFKKRPTKNTLFGYDAALLVLHAVTMGATTRDALQRALAGTESYQGFHAKISLTGRRVNTWMTVLRYAKDEIRRIGEIQAETPPGGGGSGEKRKE
jgi:ABC-type branched-subunit amino acid transport system substrate-binding protein